jgi:hypothetical protein
VTSTSWPECPFVADAADPSDDSELAEDRGGAREAYRAGGEIRFSIKRGVVDLMKGFSLAAFEDIGGEWKTPLASEAFDARYGRR